MKEVFYIHVHMYVCIYLNIYFIKKGVECERIYVTGVVSGPTEMFSKCWPPMKTILSSAVRCLYKHVMY